MYCYLSIIYKVTKCVDSSQLVLKRTIPEEGLKKKHHDYTDIYLVASGCKEAGC